jgi:hypothetical protein
LSDFQIPLDAPGAGTELEVTFCPMKMKGRAVASSRPDLGRESVPEGGADDPRRGYSGW